MVKSVVDPGFPRMERQRTRKGVPAYDLAQLSRKLHEDEDEENCAEVEGACSKIAYVDPPLFLFLKNHGV